MKKAKIFIWAEIASFLGLSLTFLYYGYQSYFKDQPLLLSKFFPKLMLAFVALIVVFGICNLISAINIRGKLSDNANQRQLWHLTVLMKIVFVPMFFLNFIFGAIFAVFGMFFVVTLPYLLALVLAAWFAMMSSSGYCIMMILHAQKQRRMSFGAAIFNIILQLIFALDVIGLIFIRKSICKAES